MWIFHINQWFEILCMLIHYGRRCWRISDEQMSPSIVTIPKAHAPTRASKLERFSLIGELAWNLVVSSNRDNIKKLVIDEYESQKKQLNRKLNNKFIYLKMDACTHHHVNYFVINTLASVRFRGFSEKKKPKHTWLCAVIFPVLVRSVKRRGKSSSLHSKKIFLLGGCGFFVSDVISGGLLGHLDPLCLALGTNR